MGGGYAHDKGNSAATGEGRAFQNVEPPRRRATGGQFLALIGFIGLCLLVAASGAAVTAGSVRSWYPNLVSPPGTPPNWLFGPVWTTLYVLIGVSAWLVWRRAAEGGPRGYAALRLWGWQLGLNALWTPAFFGMHALGLALAVILLLLGAIALTVRAFARIDRTAAGLLLPYAAWVLYATYLNAGFWFLNPG